MITFLLFGKFQICLSDGRTETIADTMAARILAFLAYQNRFCARNEIVAACWGAHRVSGRDRLEDEAYQKQISNLRGIFTERLGVPWQDYLLTQPNGAQLKDGAFTTDVMQFNGLLAAGYGRSNDLNDRQAKLLEADALRRGYFLDGMNCEWIISQDGGARTDYTARFKDLRQEIQQLGSSAEHQAAPHVPYYDSLYEAIPDLRKAISQAKREIVLCGISLNVTIPIIYDILLDRLGDGLTIKFLLLDPASQWLSHFAAITGSDTVTQKQEVILTLHRLSSLISKAPAPPASDTINQLLIDVSVFDGFLPGRIYAVDPQNEDGQLFYFPYLNATTPSRLPGFTWSQRQTGPFETYTHAIWQLWQNRSRSDVRQ